ncbi:MAG: hypothetical protein HND47_16550 [Chloroflexi bacterium]|nr:hypothetical protein [Chloroflexota bacterium]
MTENQVRGEMHGCIVCGKPYQLYIVLDVQGKFVDCKVMSAGGRVVPHPARPLVTCEKHSEEEVESAVKRVYGKQEEDED